MATINTNNYTITSIDVYYEPSVAHASLLDTTATTTVGSSFRAAKRNIGNIVSINMNPEVTYVEHFIGKLGKRKRDKVVANTESLLINFTFDEINATNIKRFFLASSLGAVTKIAPMEKPLVEGTVSMIARTDIGQSFVYSIPKAVLRPDGSFSIGDSSDWLQAPMVIEVFYYDTDQWASKPFGLITMV